MKLIFLWCWQYGTWRFLLQPHGTRGGKCPSVTWHGVPCRTLIIRISECEIAEVASRIQERRLKWKKERKIEGEEVRKYNKCVAPTPNKNNYQRVAVIRKIKEKAVDNTAHQRGRYSRPSTQEITKGKGVSYGVHPKLCQHTNMETFTFQDIILSQRENLCDHLRK